MSVQPTDQTRAARSKSDRVYGELKQRILDGRFSSGHRLVIDQMARELNVSAVPVREAIRRLEAEGFVLFRRNVGAQVTGIDPEAYAHAMEALAFLEGAATALGAGLLTKSDLVKARAVNERMRDSRERFDAMAFTAANQEFHSILCGRCPNPRLSELVQREWQRLGMIRRSTFSYVPSRATGSVEEHEALLELIAQRAPLSDIELAAREHKLRTLREFLLQYGDSGRQRPVTA